jgi:hypothetical protein
MPPVRGSMLAPRMSSRSSASPDAQPVPLGAQSVDRSGCTGWGLGPVTVLSPSYEGLLTPTILTPGWHQGSGQFRQHADVYACGGTIEPPRWS